jgi:hypothetical protein
MVYLLKGHCMAGSWRFVQLDSNGERELDERDETRSR